jgi:hypothetical protein
MSKEHVNHPTHYGGEDNPYEAIKVIDAWDLGFSLGNVRGINLGIGCVLSFKI